MEEIDLKELFGFVKGKIWTLILITFSVCLIGCIYGLFIQKPMYRSYTTVILGSNESNNSNTNGISQTDIAINNHLVDTYTEIVKSRRVLNKVIEELNMDISYEALSGKISVSSVNNTEIIKIAVSDLNGKTAKNIANVTANYFTSEVKELYNMNNVNILDEATEPSKPFNINVLKQVVMYFMGGFVMSFGLIFLMYYFDRTIKTTEQIESKIKLPILGTVEESGKEGR